MSSISGDLDGKVAIVTGAGAPGNIGATTARLLATRGARVMLADIAASELIATVEGLRRDGLEVAHCTADISDEASVQALIAQTIATFGRLDVLDNNAASQGHAGDMLITDMSVDLWDQIMSVNARGTMLMCKHAIPAMISSGGGSIINIGSGTALAGDNFSAAYGCSKGLVNTLTKYVAAQYGAQRIRCNVLSVGLVMTSKLLAVMPPPMREIFRTYTLAGRLGQPSDIAEMVAFLASDRSGFITGQILPIDGGIYGFVPTMPSINAMMQPAG